MITQTRLFRRLAELSEAETPLAIATIVKATGSVPNEVGAKMLVGADGSLLEGTIGGGRIEHDTLAAAAEAIADGASRTLVAKLTPQAAGGIGMNCGGSVEVFIDVQRPAPRLLLCGAGHINIALASMTRGLGYVVTVVDPRGEWLNRSNYPDAEVRLAQADPATYLREHGADAYSYVVVATPAGDLDVLEAAASTDAPYIGVVASKRKAISLLRQLAARDVTAYEAIVARYRAPIGLDLGGREPQAVALSILSEIQAERHGREALMMTLTTERLRELVARKGMRAVGES